MINRVNNKLIKYIKIRLTDITDKLQEREK